MRQIMNALYKTFFFFLSISLTIFAQPDEKQMQEMMAMMMPGPEHEYLAKFEGSWKSQFKFYMTPGAEPIESTGESENKMILGGRFLQITATGEMMGQPTEGLSLLGYDNRLKVFTFYGFDTMGTYAITPVGEKLDENTLEYKGENWEPQINDFSNYRIVFKMIDENSYTSELYFLFPGQDKEVKMLEVLSIRK